MKEDARPAPSRLWIKAAVAWLVLNLALAATVMGAYLDIAAWRLPLALAIAAAKGALVIVVFMELIKATAGARLAVLAGVLWLGLLIGLTFADEATRLHLPARVDSAAGR